MDPLSITASAVAVATVTAQIISLLSDIRSSGKAWPGRLHALNNELEDLSVVLHQVMTTVENRKSRKIHGDVEENIPQLLAQGWQQLASLQAILARLTSPEGTKSDNAVTRALLWRREQPQVAAIQVAIKRVKSSLNVLLGASNSYALLTTTADEAVANYGQGGHDAYST